MHAYLVRPPQFLQQIDKILHNKQDSATMKGAINDTSNAIVLNAPG